MTKLKLKSYIFKSSNKFFERKTTKKKKKTLERCQNLSKEEKEESDNMAVNIK